MTTASHAQQLTPVPPPKQRTSRGHTLHIVSESQAQPRSASVNLDDIARDPRSASALSIEEANDLLLVCASVMAVLRERAAIPVARHGIDRLIDAAEVGELLVRSKRWVEDHLEDLPERRSLSGSPFWLLSEIEQHIRETPLYGRAA